MSFSFVGDTLLRLAAVFDKFFIWDPFLKLTKQPADAQRQVLVRILKKNENTEFGQKYNFSRLNTYKSFRSQVPVHTYEDLAPYITKQLETKKPILTIDPPVLYARTSGTTNEPKLIPVLLSTINAYKWSQRIFFYAEYSRAPSMFKGMILAIASPAIEGEKNGIPFGSMSGLVYEQTPWFMKHKFVLPPEVGSISDYDAKYIVISAFALRKKNVTALAAANPSTLLKLLGIINERKENIVRIIEAGDFSEVPGLTPEEARSMKRLFNKDESRAHELSEMLKSRQKLTFNEIWPDLAGISTWTKGSPSVILPLLKESVSKKTQIIEMGYFSSEFRGTINIDIKNNSTVPTLNENFFEFVEKEKWESNIPEFRTLELLKSGMQYYIFVTTANGLYRYHMNDIVEVTGFYNKTPIIAFLQKGKGVTNITGEKLYESQVVNAVREMSEKFAISVSFFLLVADEKNMEYRLYLESADAKEKASLENMLETALRTANIEYDAKRESGRLKPLKVLLLKAGTGDEYKKEALRRGMRENQFKTVPLQYASALSFAIDRYVIS